jgi:hypothetical protein
MGLDITAYNALTRESDVTYDHEEGVFRDRATGEDLGYDSYVRFWDNKDFPGRIEGVDPDVVYSYSQYFSFRAGSYGGYNVWRDALAELAGYPATEYETSYKGRQKSCAAACWDVEGGNLKGPFSELINFSDAEGTIGPVVAAKLAKDFEVFLPIAQEKWEGNADFHHYYQRYLDWKHAFELAADNGAVVFH